MVKKSRRSVRCSSVGSVCSAPEPAEPVSWVNKDARMAATKLRDMESEVEEIRISCAKEKKRLSKVHTILKRREAAAQKESEDYRERYQRLKEKNAVLRQRLAKAEEDSVRRAAAAPDEALTVKLNKLEAALEAGRQEAEASKATLTRMASKLNAAVEEAEALRHQKKEAGTAAAEALAKKEAELLEAKEELQRTVSERSQLREEMAIMKQSLEEKDDELASKAEAVLDVEGILSESEKCAQENKELKKQNEKKEKRLEALKKEVADKAALIETLGEEKAERDARISELTRSTACTSQVETPVQCVSSQQLGRLSRLSVGSVEDPPVLSARSSIRRCIDETDFVIERDADECISIPSATPTKNTAPPVYAQQLTRSDRESYRAALDEQVAQKRSLASKRKNGDGDDFFRFGTAGSGAPIRDQNNEVVTNVTFTRSTNYLPIDHPMSARKPKKARSF